MQERGQDDQGQPEYPYAPTRSRSGQPPQWGAQQPDWAQQPGQAQYGEQQAHPGQPGPQPPQHGGQQQAPAGPQPKKKSKLGCLSVVGAVVLVVIAVALSSGSSSTPTQTPMQQAVTQLQTEDSNTHAAGQYQTALTALTKQCTQTNPVQLANMTDAVETGLTQDHITQDRLSLLQEFSKSIPTGSKPMNCVDIFAAYETLREG